MKHSLLEYVNNIKHELLLEGDSRASMYIGFIEFLDKAEFIKLDTYEMIEKFECTFFVCGHTIYHSRESYKIDSLCNMILVEYARLILQYTIAKSKVRLMRMEKFIGHYNITVSKQSDYSDNQIGIINNYIFNLNKLSDMYKTSLVLEYKNVRVWHLEMVSDFGVSKAVLPNAMYNVGSTVYIDTNTNIVISYKDILDMHGNEFNTTLSLIEDSRLDFLKTEIMLANRVKGREV